MWSYFRERERERGVRINKEAIFESFVWQKCGEKRYGREKQEW
jgi:hypothetical protein